MMDEFKPEGVPVEGDTISNTIVPIPVSDEPVEAKEAAPAESPRETEQAKNFRTMRESNERIARERDEALRRLQEYEARQSRPQQDAAETGIPEEDIEFNVKDDDLVEGKHLQKMKTYIKKLEAQQRAFQKKASEATAETRLRAQYPDFDKVVTIENMRALARDLPELAESVGSSPDLYSKAVSAYTLIKKFGIYEETPYATEKERALANTVKPKPLTSISPQQGDTPLSRVNIFANGLTDDLKRKLREEMVAASRKY